MRLVYRHVVTLVFTLVRNLILNRNVTTTKLITWISPSSLVSSPLVREKDDLTPIESLTWPATLDSCFAEKSETCMDTLHPDNTNLGEWALPFVVE